MTQRKIALSIEEAADYIGIGRNTMRKLVDRWEKSTRNIAGISSVSWWQ